MVLLQIRALDLDPSLIQDIKIKHKDLDPSNKWIQILWIVSERKKHCQIQNVYRYEQKFSNPPLPRLIFYVKIRLIVEIRLTLMHSEQSKLYEFWPY